MKQRSTEYGNPVVGRFTALSPHLTTRDTGEHGAADGGAKWPVSCVRAACGTMVPYPVALLLVALGATPALVDAQGCADLYPEPCVSMVVFGCDTDMATFQNTFPPGSLVSVLCPVSCNTCGVPTPSCDPSASDERVMSVMDACCPATGGGGHRRQQDTHESCPLPETCPSETCAAEFMSLMDDCGDALNLEATPGFPAFYAACHTLADHNHMDTLVTCTTVGGDWVWTGLPCAPTLERSDRGYVRHPSGEERCTCHRTSTDHDDPYDGPASAAECGHVICASLGYPSAPGYDSCSWDGNVIVTAEAATDGSLTTTLTSDPAALCVTCSASGTGSQSVWEWSNLPCEPGIDRLEALFDYSPEGDERCICTRASDGTAAAFDGPESPGQCGHMICHSDSSPGTS